MMIINDYVPDSYSIYYAILFTVIFRVYSSYTLKKCAVKQYAGSREQQPHTPRDYFVS